MKFSQLEYDLVNISMTGLDPATGRSFEESRAEWKRELNEVIEQVENLRWWQFRRGSQIRTKLVNMQSRFNALGVKVASLGMKVRN
jgi:hypothetical protein